MTPNASIVIPTYNRARSLERALRSIGKYPFGSAFDVTVIDDGSPDDTSEVLRRLQCEMPYPLFFHTQPNAGPATARNLGIAATKGQYVVFLDDDHEVLPGWLDALCEPLSDPDIGIVNGKNDSVPDGGIAARYVCLCDVRDAQKVETDKTRYLTSGNAAIRRETLEATGGFDPAYRAVFKGVAPGGEDTELGMRICGLGLKIAYRPNAHTLHYREMTLSKLFKERFNFGRNRVLWLKAEGRPLTIGAVVCNILRTALSLVAAPKHIIAFRKQGYTCTDSIAFALMDKLTRITYEFGTLYGVGRNNV